MFFLSFQRLVVPLLLHSCPVALFPLLPRHVDVVWLSVLTSPGMVLENFFSFHFYGSAALGCVAYAFTNCFGFGLACKYGLYSFFGYDSPGPLPSLKWVIFSRQCFSPFSNHAVSLVLACMEGIGLTPSLTSLSRLP